MNHRITALALVALPPTLWGAASLGSAPGSQDTATLAPGPDTGAPFSPVIELAGELTAQSMFTLSDVVLDAQDGEALRFLAYTSDVYLPGQRVGGGFGLLSVAPGSDEPLQIGDVAGTPTTYEDWLRPEPETSYSASIEIRPKEDSSWAHVQSFADVDLIVTPR